MFTKQLSSITSYLPPLWLSLDTLDDDGADDLYEGDLVAYVDPYDDHEGVGIIKQFTLHEFRIDGIWQMLPCAILVSANPHTNWLTYVPLSHVELITLSDYTDLYEAEYGTLHSEDLQCLRYAVYAKQSAYGWQRGSRGSDWNLFPMFTPANPVPVRSA